MSTVVFQFEYNYPYHRNKDEEKYVIDACVFISDIVRLLFLM